MKKKEVKFLAEAFKAENTREPHRTLGNYIAVRIIPMSRLAKTENLSIMINDFSAVVMPNVPVALPEKVVNFLKNELHEIKYRKVKEDEATEEEIEESLARDEENKELS